MRWSMQKRMPIFVFCGRPNSQTSKNCESVKSTIEFIGRNTQIWDEL